MKSKIFKTITLPVFVVGALACPQAYGQEIAAQPGDDIEAEFQDKGSAAAKVVENRPVILIENEAGGIIDSVLQDEPFKIRVLVPRSEENPPGTIEVTLDSNQWWALNKDVTLSNVDLRGAFAGYLSDAITLRQLWSWRYAIQGEDPDRPTLPYMLRGFTTGNSWTRGPERITARHRDATVVFTAYEDPLRRRIGQIKQALDQAEAFYRRYLNEGLSELIRDGLSPDEAEATREMIQQKMGLINRAQQILARDALDDYERVAVGERLLPLLGTDPKAWRVTEVSDSILPEATSKVWERVGAAVRGVGVTPWEHAAIASGMEDARTLQLSEIGTRGQMLSKALAAEAAHSTPVASLYTLVTGKTWEGNPATLSDYLLAGGNLWLTGVPVARFFSGGARAAGAGATTAVRGAGTSGSRAAVGELPVGSRGAATATELGAGSRAAADMKDTVTGGLRAGPAGGVPPAGRRVRGLLDRPKDFPVAVRDERALRQHFEGRGFRVKRLGRRNPENVLVVEGPDGEIQVWVRPQRRGPGGEIIRSEFQDYREVYQEAHKLDRIPATMDIDHIQSKARAGLQEYGYVRLLPVDKDANQAWGRWLEKDVLKVRTQLDVGRPVDVRQIDHFQWWKINGWHPNDVLPAGWAGRRVRVR